MFSHLDVIASRAFAFRGVAIFHYKEIATGGSVPPSQ
jgi:hypothetical protein